jgi:protein NRD1
MLVDFKTRLANASSSQRKVLPLIQHAMLTLSSDILTQAAPPNDPASLLAALAAPPQAAPPQAAQHQNQAQHQAQNNASANALLAALSGMGQHPAPTQQVTNGAPMNYAPSNPTMNYPPQNAPVARQQAPQQAQVPYGAPLQQQPALNLNALASLLPNAQGGAQDPNSLVNQLQMLQALGQQLGPDGFRTLVQALTMQQQQQQPLPPQPVAAQNGVFAQNPVAAPIPQNLNQYSAPTGNGYAPPGGQLYGARDDSGAGARERSRSPDWNQRRYSPPNRRDSPTYGSYDAHTGRVGSPRGQDDRRGRGRGRGGGRSDYRQRSPPSRNSPAPHSNQPKPIGYDNKLPDGCIKGNAPVRMSVVLRLLILLCSIESNFVRWWRKVSGTISGL